MRWYDVAAIGLAVLLQQVAPSTAAAAPSDDKAKSREDPPCTVHSPNSGSFFDLNPILLAPPESGKKAQKDQRTSSWHARGYDYPANFTLNVCAPVIEKLQDVQGLQESRWRNVSAYYELHGKVYSIG